ncbi:MAG: hypothetical protein QNJ54_01540 [Prochloraceae cyanobacterium]|nr:hypothetical protein [Prochloraceae cyanobacterium]
MTTFERVILDKLNLNNESLLALSEAIEGFEGSQTGETPTSSLVLCVANYNIRYFVGQQTFLVPDSIAISLVMKSGTGTIPSPTGNIPMSQGFSLHLPFRAINYFYRQFQFELLTSDAEAFLLYEAQPTKEVLTP